MKLALGLGLGKGLSELVAVPLAGALARGLGVSFARE